MRAGLVLPLIRVWYANLDGCMHSLQKRLCSQRGIPSRSSDTRSDIVSQCG